MFMCMCVCVCWVIDKKKREKTGYTILHTLFGARGRKLDGDDTGQVGVAEEGLHGQFPQAAAQVDQGPIILIKEKKITHIISRREDPVQSVICTHTPALSCVAVVLV
jgi:hypothetical protein